MPDEVKKPKVLVVEDDIFMQELLGNELRSAGIEVDVATNGSEALPKFRQFAPDLVLLDILLPDVNGFDVLRQIRREPNGMEVKAIFLSNLGETKDMEEAKRIGAIDYFVKANFSLSEIVEKIKAVFSPKPA